MLRRILCFIAAVLITVFIFYVFVELPSRTAQTPQNQNELDQPQTEFIPPHTEQDIANIWGKF